MAELRCVDGSVLSVLPVPCLGRDGVPYEATLQLRKDGRPFGEVGQRCVYFLAATAARLREARQEDGPEAFPRSACEVGLRAFLHDSGDEAQEVWPLLQRYLPPDRELFAFRARDPDDVAAVAELRAEVREEHTWTPAADGQPGRWARRSVAVVDAWGVDGTGVRAVLSSAGLLALLDAVLGECAELGLGPDVELDLRRARRPVG